MSAGNFREISRWKISLVSASLMLLITPKLYNVMR
jgi:hypothetical protein